MENRSAGSLDVFERVAAGELSSEEGARIISGRQRRRRSWMPRRIYEPISAWISYMGFLIETRKDRKG